MVSATALTAGVLLALPAASRAGTDPTAQDVHRASPAQPAVAAAQPQNQAADWLGDLKIHPARISTAQPAKPGRPAAGSDGLLGPAGVTGELGIPAMVLQAYRQAAATMAAEQLSCHLPWWLLAGIGHTESGHAEGGRLYSDGTTRGRILGPVLDGTLADNAVITDTDHGRYDGDPRFDRAVGPMQFIPSTWVHWGADGNHDGKSDPNNVFDATLAAGRYLCADGRDLATMPGLEAAVLSYNHSQAYLDTVLAWGLAYRNGASSVADLNAPVIRDVTKVRPPLTARPPKKPRKLTPAGGTAAPSSSAARSGAASSSAATSSGAASSSTASSTAATSSSASTPASSSAAASPSCTSATPSSTSSTRTASAQATALSSADGGSATVAAQSASGATTSSTSATSTPTPSCSRLTGVAR